MKQLKTKNKNTQFESQLQQVYNVFKEGPMTMKEADVLSGVMRESICRHVNTLLKQGRIAIIRRRKCTVTGFNSVNEYTTDPNLFPKSNHQLNLEL